MTAAERHVVIVEDERDVARLLDYNLRTAGYAVTWATTGAGGLAMIRSRLPDVVLLDLMLPDRSGYELCRAIRGDATTADLGVLMLTAKSEAKDRIFGLEAGADDYVTKPFVVREVVLRVHALAKRLGERRDRPANGDASHVLEVGSIRLDPILHDVTIGGVPTHLRALEYKLLHTLVAKPGRVFSREELLEQVWYLHGDTYTRTVDVHVRRLRKNLGPAAELIETVHGFGYRARLVPS